jgi:trimethylamine:corrinoid methyltransferase-like protein
MIDRITDLSNESRRANDYQDGSKLADMQKQIDHLQALILEMRDSKKPKKPTNKRK